MIRNLTDEEITAIEIAKQKTGHKTACKAVMAATQSFERMAKIVANLQEENNRLRRENRKLKLCISSVTEAVNKIGTILGDSSKNGNDQDGEEEKRE